MQLDVGHHILGIPPVLESMRELGFSDEECLLGTGLESSDPNDTDARKRFTLEAEFRLYRNAQRLSQDPSIGLRLGQAFPLESYGMFGYAMLSARSVAQALAICSHYGALTYTVFHIDFIEHADYGVWAFSRYLPLPDDLFALYCERDLAGGLFGIETATKEKAKVQCVRVMHTDEGRRQALQAHFGCAVEFGCRRNEIVFDVEALATPMPMSNPESSALCQQQCQQLVARLSRRSHFVDVVRKRILAQPGYFPSLEQVADDLALSPRTLRRRVEGEGSRFQEILDEVRLGLAKDYLANSTLSIEQVAELLGFSHTGNFSHAFKRWSGVPPLEFRRNPGSISSGSSMLD